MHPAVEVACPQVVERLMSPKDSGASKRLRRTADGMYVFDGDPDVLTFTEVCENTYDIVDAYDTSEWGLHAVLAASYSWPRRMGTSSIGWNQNVERIHGNSDVVVYDRGRCVVSGYTRRRFDEEFVYLTDYERALLEASS